MLYNVYRSLGTNRAGLNTNPTHDQTQWFSDLEKKKEIRLCISHSESLCNRDYPPDPQDPKRR